MVHFWDKLNLNFVLKKKYRETLPDTQFFATPLKSLSILLKVWDLNLPKTDFIEWIENSNRSSLSKNNL